jgi:molybdopterin-guanine dinucleotide biosynthesis protein A
VLAGGASQRMGSDKAWLAMHGRPMAVHVAAALAGVCGRVRVVRRREASLAPPGLEVVVGAEGETRHPLWGVSVAAEACDSPWMLIAPCDVPWLTTEALQYLWEARGTDGAVAMAEGRMHPLVAVLSAEHGRLAGAAAAAGGSARRFMASLCPVELEPSVLRNANRPSDLRVGRPSSG